MRFRCTLAGFAFSLLAFAAATLARGDNVLTLHYPPSDQEGELAVEVMTYYLWLPPDAKTIRGVIVHQHGCGEGAKLGGETAVIYLNISYPQFQGSIGYANLKNHDKVLDFFTGDRSG